MCFSLIKHNRLLTFQRQCGSIPLATRHHRHHKLQLVTFSPFNLHPMPLDREDQGLRLKSEQPVMYDNLLAASAARRYLIHKHYSSPLTSLAHNFSRERHQALDYLHVCELAMDWVMSMVSSLQHSSSPPALSCISQNIFQTSFKLITT
jgi:hypothetical protein